MVCPAVFLLIAAANQYVVEGQITPPRTASVTLYGATTPFTVSTLAGADGRFSLKKLDEGSYTLAVFAPNLGERRQTVVVSPSTADKRGRVRVAVTLDESRVVADAASVVSMRELAIPKAAREAYSQAQKSLSRRDTAAAVSQLERAVELAPQFSEAWNHLGTIAYQTQQYARAEEMFRKALLADQASYPPLVNMGGVLLNLGRPDEAWSYNVHAVLREPSDALAHAQLGMTYLVMGKLDLAEKSLLEAIRLDPAHFSYPQIHLAEVYVRKGDKQKAADVLDQFLHRHPDHENATRIRAAIVEFRASTPTSTSK